MASSSGSDGTSAPGRRRVACDVCGAAAWIGRRADGGFDGWCEACQNAVVAASPADPCTRCGGTLATGAPRFPKLWRRLERLDGVLAAWSGDAQTLARLLPPRSEYQTDLTPPGRYEADPPAVAQRIEWAIHGDWRMLTMAAASDPVPSEDPRLHIALAIAHEHLGDLAAAESAWTSTLERCESPRAHLARGALRARRGAWALAETDLRLAGDVPEACWDRAAVSVHRAVEATPGLPAIEVIEEARREAGERGPHWSEPTIGRLLWTLLLERILSRNAAERAAAATPSRAGADERLLRGAEQLLEYDTTWDRAYVLAGYALAGMPRDAHRVGAPLADRCAAALQAERAVAAETLRALAGALALTRVEIAAGEPARARALVAPALASEPLQRERVPCVQCLAGSVGVVEGAAER